MSSTDRGGPQASPRPTLASLDARLREVEEQLAQLLARHAAEDAAAASRVFPNARGRKPGRFRVTHGDFDRSDLTLHQVGELLALKPSSTRAALYSLKGGLGTWRRKIHRGTTLFTERYCEPGASSYVGVITVERVVDGEGGE